MAAGQVMGPTARRVYPASVAPIPSLGRPRSLPSSMAKTLIFSMAIGTGNGRLGVVWLRGRDALVTCGAERIVGPRVAKHADQPGPVSILLDFLECKRGEGVASHGPAHGSRFGRTLPETEASRFRNQRAMMGHCDCKTGPARWSAKTTRGNWSERSENVSELHRWRVGL